MFRELSRQKKLSYDHSNTNYSYTFSGTIGISYFLFKQNFKQLIVLFKTKMLKLVGILFFIKFKNTYVISIPSKKQM